VDAEATTAVLALPNLVDRLMAYTNPTEGNSNWNSMLFMTQLLRMRTVSVFVCLTLSDQLTVVWMGGQRDSAI
jgi:hypothetical protein